MYNFEYLGECIEKSELTPLKINIVFVPTELKQK